MRRISKALEPEFFVTWKKSEDDNWKPVYADLQNPQKEELHVSLLSEQGYTCCYCGREVSIYDSHIEHFRPRCTYSSLTLTYENLFVSCMRERQTRPQLPETCGVLKDDWFDEANHLSPLQTDCEEAFSYTLTGEIQGKTPVAELMIKVLGLDQVFLVNRRRNALEGVFDPEFITAATEAELENIRASFRTPTTNGVMTPFFQAIAVYAGQLLRSLPDATLSINK
jgi:uncharacterized protein (TIGR02646 family)